MPLRLGGSGFIEKRGKGSRQKSKVNKKVGRERLVVGRIGLQGGNSSLDTKKVQLTFFFRVGRWEVRESRGRREDNASTSKS